MPIRNLAVKLTTQGFGSAQFSSGEALRQKDFLGEAKRIFEYVRDKIRYVKDIDGIETLHDPVTLLNTGAGDCDDKAILLASLLASIGHKVRFMAVAFRKDQFDHVWLQDYIGGKWVDLETTEPLPFGRSIPTRNVVATLVQDV